ncbi:hypothetical protein C8R43DRAFT_1137849 [Mycena crocata]|nr:hypothetical protein C8R43DRAFT_1137849 [Mycena crocata]
MSSLPPGRCTSFVNRAILVKLLAVPPVTASASVPAINPGHIDPITGLFLRRAGCIPALAALYATVSSFPNLHFATNARWNRAAGGAVYPISATISSRVLAAASNGLPRAWFEGSLELVWGSVKGHKRGYGPVEASGAGMDR